jgi:hypothetical protein
MTDELKWTNILVTESEVVETLKSSIIKGPSAPGEGKMTFRDWLIEDPEGKLLTKIFNLTHLETFRLLEWLDMLL